MLATERQQQILDMLEASGTVRTVELAEEFRVTGETIRRDLQALADAKQLDRVHGGASRLNGSPALRSFSERQGLRVAEKKAIAEAALPLLQPGRMYAFDSSTTAFELVRLLPDLPFRALTNAYAVLEWLVRMENLELIAMGGRYDPKTQTFIDSDPFRTLAKYNIHTAIVSCLGLDLDRGASEGFEAQAFFKEALLRVAGEVILLVDSSKLDHRSEYFFGQLGRFHHIITDHAASPAFLRELRLRGCRVTLAQPPKRQTAAHAATTA